MEKSQVCSNKNPSKIKRALNLAPWKSVKCSTFYLQKFKKIGETKK